jgi:glucose/arabinose dehydrogenase
MRTMRMRHLVFLSAVLAACGSPNSQDGGTSDTPATSDVATDSVTLDRPTPTDAPVGMDTPTSMDVVMPTDVPVTTTDTCLGTPATGVYLADASMCIVQYANSLMRPRGIAFAPNGDLFVNDYGRITALHDDNGDGNVGTAERSVFATIHPESGTTPHGIAFSPDGAYLYASTSGTVVRWAYTSGLRTGGAMETVVTGIPVGGNHSTRTLVFDSTGRLYVSVGSQGNLDQTSTLAMTRAMIRRFTIPAMIPSGGMGYTTGEVWASGMRNDVGMTIDRLGRFWSVENGRDNTVLAGNVDVHIDNPGEEINQVSEGGNHFFGYPSCWSEGVRLTGGGGPGTQHGDVQSSVPARRDDAWCQDTANNHPPVAVMPAHWAPLGVTEYVGSTFPSDWNGDLLVTSHGSWNSESGQVGRLVARAHVAADGSISSVTPILGQAGTGGMLAQGSWNVRPVDIKVGPDGAIYFSDDQGGRIFRVGYRH